MFKKSEIREIAPELDPLRLGTGWKPEDLGKPQILIESSFGDSHPGSAHLLELSQEAKKERPQKADTGPGILHGHLRRGSPGPRRYQLLPGLPGYETNMMEIHAGATPFDGGVFIASCDKSMPAHLMAMEESIFRRWRCRAG